MKRKIAGNGARAKAAACRPLSQEEIAAVFAALDTPRDRALFAVGLYCGFRVCSVLSLTVGDARVALQTGRLYLSKAGGKGAASSFSVPLKEDGRSAIASLMEALEGTGEAERVAATAPLFQSRKRERDGRIGCLRRIQAYRILRDAFERAELTGLEVPGLVATHSMRKTFAKNAYSKATARMIETGGAAGEAIELTRRALGHRDIESTLHYLPVDTADVDALF